MRVWLLLLFSCAREELPLSVDSRSAITSDAATLARPAERREVAFSAQRTAYVAAPAGDLRKHRVIAHLHGMCSPPTQGCATWSGAATKFGVLVCPQGDGRCAGGPSWEPPFERVDTDVETALDAVARELPGELSSEGAVLSGYSLGAHLAWRLVKLHPGRWPYLILGGAFVRVSASELRAYKVKALALIAGDGDPEIEQIRGRLEKLQGYPAKLWVIPKMTHDYPPHIDAVMGEALGFLTSH